jgi:hypothetical protein
MPTPIPIMRARVGAAVPNVVAAAARPSRLTPTKTPTSAVPKGSSAPNTLPKPINSTMSATPNPISSDFLSLADGFVSSSSAPPYCTSSPALVAGDVAAYSLGRYELPRVFGRTLNCTVDTTVVGGLLEPPVLPPVAAAKGSLADSTCGSLASFATLLSIGLCAAAIDPLRVWKTIKPL